MSGAGTIVLISVQKKPLSSNHALSAVNMDVCPFQIAVAMFALHSPYLNGAILADEGSLGKAYEAMLSDSMPTTILWTLEDVEHNDSVNKEIRSLFDSTARSIHLSRVMPIPVKVGKSASATQIKR